MREGWEALTKSAQTTHFSVSTAKRRFTFRYRHNSDDRHKCHSTCLNDATLGLNTSISAQSFRGRESTPGLPFEVKNTQGKRILTNFAWSPQSTSGTCVSERSVLRADVLQNLSAEQRYKITSSQIPTQYTDENSSRQQGARKAFEQRSKSS